MYGLNDSNTAVLNASSVARIAVNLEYLRMAAASRFPVVHPDGAISKEGTGYIVSTLIELNDLFNRFNLLSGENFYLLDMVNKFLPKYSQRGNKQIDLEDAKALADLITTISALFYNLLRERDFYEIKIAIGRLDYKRLLNGGANILFDDQVLLNELSRENIVIGDINDAIFCIANNKPTPAVMLSLRAVEGMLRHIYKRIKNKSPEGMTWDPIQKEIMSAIMSTGGRVKEIDGYLNYLKDRRDDAAHPTKRFTLTEAEDTIMQAQRAISELNKISKS